MGAAGEQAECLRQRKDDADVLVSFSNTFSSTHPVLSKRTVPLWELCTRLWREARHRPWWSLSWPCRWPTAMAGMCHVPVHAQTPQLADTVGPFSSAACQHSRVRARTPRPGCCCRPTRGRFFSTWNRATSCFAGKTEAIRLNPEPSRFCRARWQRERWG